MQHCPLHSRCIYFSFFSLCGTLLHMGSARVAYTACPCHKVEQKQDIELLIPSSLLRARHSRASIARQRLFARWLSYNQSNNPIIQSNWTQCSIILHSDNAHLHCPCDRCQKKRAKKRGAGRFQIIKINRCSCCSVLSASTVETCSPRSEIWPESSRRL